MSIWLLMLILDAYTHKGITAVLITKITIRKWAHLHLRQLFKFTIHSMSTLQELVGN